MSTLRSAEAVKPWLRPRHSTTRTLPRTGLVTVRLRLDWETWREPAGRTALSSEEITAVSTCPPCLSVRLQLSLPGVQEPHLPLGHPAAVPVVRVLSVVRQAGTGVTAHSVPAHLGTDLRWRLAFINVWIGERVFIIRYFTLLSGPT